MRPIPPTTSTTAAIATTAIAEALATTPSDARLHNLSQPLAAAARTEGELPSPDWPKAKALRLVADACTMVLAVGGGTSEPFKPRFMDAAGGRTATAEDFSPDDAAFFSDVAAVETRRAIRARLADVAWLRARPRKNIADARHAIDAYVEVEPTETNWIDEQAQWERAITLCIQLGKGAEDRLERIKEALTRIARAAIPAGERLGLAVAEILFGRELVTDDGFPELLAARGEQLLTAAAIDPFLARRHLELAQRWFSRLGNAERAADMTLRIGLSLEAQAPIFLDDAIQTLRKIPKEQRAARDVDKHLDRLIARLPAAGAQALSAMRTVTSGEVDIEELVRGAEREVAGKDPLLALKAFVLLHRGARAGKLKDEATEALRSSPFSSMMGVTFYSSDGRVIAKAPAIGSGEEIDGIDARVYQAMILDFQRDAHLVCTALLMPALLKMRSEHTLTRSDLGQLTSLAPIIPPGRAEQVAKGLWEGFELDFASAIYILAPQVEHLVRWHLKQAGGDLGFRAKTGVSCCRLTRARSLRSQLGALFSRLLRQP